MADVQRYWDALRLAVGQMAYAASEERLLPVVMIALPLDSREGRMPAVLLAPGCEASDARGLLYDALSAIAQGRVVNTDLEKGGGR